MVHRTTTIPRRQRLLDEAKAVMAKRLAEELRLDDVARELATSRRQLQRVFLEIAGSSYRELLTAMRMERAGELLVENPGLSVKDAGLAVGYRQTAYFAKLFRRHHGLSPSAWRERAAGAPALAAADADAVGV